VSWPKEKSPKIMEKYHFQCQFMSGPWILEFVK